MTEIRRAWNAALPPLPERELEALGGIVSGELYEAAACFRLFRYLHGTESAECTLVGDLCFGRFSSHLAALDSVELTDAFAGFLRRDTVSRLGWEDYRDFVAGLERLI